MGCEQMAQMARICRTSFICGNLRNLRMVLTAGRA
jgi:hypothetical protein